MGSFNEATPRRAHAIIQAEAFLIELSKNTSLPDEWLQGALRFASHYLSRDEVLLADEIEEVLMLGTILSSQEE